MPLLGIYPKKTASLTQKDGCTPTSTAVSPTTAEIRSSPDSDRLRKRDTSEGDVEQNPAAWNKIVCIDLEGIVRSAMNQLNTLLFCVESQQTNNSTGRLETTDAMARGNPQYNWSLKTQGVILSSIMYGLLIAQIPAGYLSGIFSIRKMIGCSLLLSSLLTLLTPLAATAGEAFLMACRALQGLGQGTTLTAQHVIWVKWAPPLEQGRLTSMSISGACGCALSLVWFALYHDNPEAHPCISVAERDFITASLAGQVSSSGHTLPIRAMLRSLPVWVISLTSFAYFWMMRIIIFYSPMFISSSLHTEVQENGMLSALPYLFAWILSFLSGPMADCFLARNILSMLTVRKLFTTLGLLLPAVFSVCLASAGSSIQSVVVFLVLTNATTSFCTVGMLINPLDIAPRYYGFLKGMTILIGMTGGLISTTVTGIILDQDPESSWFKIFFLMAAINVTSLILYLIFAKAEIQDWAKERQHTRL
ncbi:sodium-dependent phosphate transport protein 1-like isoform X3 [Pteropus medius]|uniref:sodium-dependent phosphate transport protein 1-like isoform X3 n=1 Tax=Pteropus vampyrus TaxID=132908 RepID=UPI00196B5E4A|nr:sodium-dependent phosphate transport protein 1-like isoform X3 [Pteropus giganteus]